MSNDRAARGKKICDEAFGKDGLKTWDELNARSARRTPAPFTNIASAPSGTGRIST